MLDNLLDCRFNRKLLQLMGSQQSEWSEKIQICNRSHLLDHEKKLLLNNKEAAVDTKNTAYENSYF